MDNEQGVKLLQWLKRCRRLEDCTDKELGDLLGEHIWDDLPLLSFENDLVAEVIARLRKEKQPLTAEVQRSGI